MPCRELTVRAEGVVVAGDLAITVGVQGIELGLVGGRFLRVGVAARVGQGKARVSSLDQNGNHDEAIKEHTPLSQVRRPNNDGVG